MYTLTSKSIAPSVYGKDLILASESMLKLQTRAIKAAAELVALNPINLSYDRKRKGGVITVTVSRTNGRDSSAIVVYTIRKLLVI